jgi:hypothetical protein
MIGSHTYVLSIHEPEGYIVLEDVRTRRRARLADLAEIGDQLTRWTEHERDPESGKRRSQRDDLR